MKVVDGLLNSKKKKPPNPKPSPKDFVWPPQEHDDKVAQKLAASLQELLPKRGWKHTDLARELYGTFGPNDTPRNPSPCRRWVVAEHPIPNEETAGFIAQVLDVSMARLLEPEGKYDPTPAMIRPRSDSKRFPSGNKPKAKKKKAAKVAAKVKLKAKTKAKRPYVRKAKVNGHAAGDGARWTLADGVEAPDYTITSGDCPPGHLKLELKAVLPHERTMAILHMLQHEAEAG